jgi:HEAT repeat protein
MLALALAALLPALCASGCASLPDEVGELRAPDAEDRIDAALLLARKVSEDDADYAPHKAEIAAGLRALLDDRSALVRQVAIDSLAKVEGRAAAGVIADRLRDKDPWVRLTAVKRLSDIEARTAVEPVATLLRGDESADVRREAAKFLGKMKARNALRELVRALSDRVPAVRYNAYLALRAATGEDRGEDPRMWRSLAPDGAPGGD